MFPNVKKRMIDLDMSTAELSRRTGIPLPTLYVKLRGDSEFKLSQMKQIRRVLEVPEIPLEVLFEARQVKR